MGLVSKMTLLGMGSGPGAIRLVRSPTECSLLLMHSAVCQALKITVLYATREAANEMG